MLNTIKSIIAKLYLAYINHTESVAEDRENAIRIAHGEEQMPKRLFMVLNKIESSENGSDIAISVANSRKVEFKEEFKDFESNLRQQLEAILEEEKATLDELVKQQDRIINRETGNLDKNALLRKKIGLPPRKS